MDDRQRLEQMVNEINMYQSQLDVLNQQMETVKATMAELTSAEDTLNAVEGKEGTETFVPIGAGSFIITELKNTDEVIMGLGAGAAAKKSLPEAKENISTQKKELEQLMNKMMGDMKKLTEVIVKMSPEAEALLKKVETEEAGHQ
ncbi:MAG: prefoldin subunit alpha [Methanobacterium sp.]|uniref:prefoldin subunit alpha n=1 Tax=Methanobacterium sp. TaxID=2164 RepID=UPI003D64EBF0|nr:prefoldin subunit alpha [Methanobacterium sp.]